ncbi:MAG: RIP metalloprotease RseP [Verrucomicrobia bacterium]|nr:RIP metalloprotease RseP [Verrucomicrobiota bacterium]
MSEFLNYLYIAAGVLISFGAAVFVHEYGHFWMARRRGLKIEEFAIGFGPKAYSWVKDGILYSLRWIPAGGFVKLPQMITSEALEGSRNPSEEPLPPISPWSKILVAFAGPFMNVVFAFVIATAIYVVGLPILVNPSIIGYVDPNSAEAKLGIHEGDQIVEVNGKPVNSWQDVQMATVLARTNVLPVVIELDGVRTTHRLTAKINPTLGWKVLNLEPRDHPEVTRVLPKMPGERAGLRVKDVILSFGGIPIAAREQLIELIRRHPDIETEIMVARANERLALKVTPAADPTTKKGFVGIELGINSDNVYVVQRPGPNPWAQVADVWEKTVGTLSALAHSKQTGVGLKDLSGPIGIFAMLSGYFNTDYRLALSFLVLLNINLAILNLLPVPVLDGGHILMAIIERIRRRPLSVRVMEYTTTAFAVLLISFLLYVSFHDTKRFRLFKTFFESGSVIEEPGSKAPAAPAPAR